MDSLAHGESVEEADEAIAAATATTASASAKEATGLENPEAATPEPPGSVTSFGVQGSEPDAALTPVASRRLHTGPRFGWFGLCTLRSLRSMAPTRASDPQKPSAGYLRRFLSSRVAGLSSAKARDGGDDEGSEEGSSPPTKEPSAAELARGESGKLIAREERAEVARPFGEQRRTHRSLRVLHCRVLRVRRRAHRARRADARAHVHGLGRRGQRRERRLELVVEQRLDGERNPLSDRCESLLGERLG